MNNEFENLADCNLETVTGGGLVGALPKVAKKVGQVAKSKWDEFKDLNVKDQALTAASLTTIVGFPLLTANRFAGASF